jgi:hypothetical protein
MISEILGQKQCASCKEIKLLDAFYKNSGGSQGVQNYCKACCKQIRERKAFVECDFKISKQCLGNHEVLITTKNKNLQNNKGKYRCLYCGIENTHLDSLKVYKK